MLFFSKKSSEIAPEKQSRLLNKNFLLFWQGQLVSSIGSHISGVAVTLWIAERTDSATLVGVTMIALLLPSIFIGPFAGVVADQYSRKLIIILSDLFCSILYFSIAVLFFFFPENYLLIFWGLFVLNLGESSCQTFSHPAMLSFIPDIVPREKISAALSLDATSNNIVVMLGKGIGGLLYRLVGLPFILVINAVTFLCSAISESFICEKHAKSDISVSAESSPFLKFVISLKEGMMMIWNWKGLREVIFVNAVLAFLVQPVFVALPFYVKNYDYLNSTSDWLGYMYMGLGAGTVVGNWLASYLLQRNNPVVGVIVIICMSSLGCCYGALGFVKSPGGALLLLILAGCIAGIINIFFHVKSQLSVPRNLRGRLVAFSTSFTFLFSPLGLGLGGVFIDFFEKKLHFIFWGCGACMVLASFLALAAKNYRHFFLDALFADDDEIR
ncbi:MAG: MFS transporter [Candidatus Electrothrix sp. AR5]|nr:MFS transporter [Candidatus Electrothrix sp. AR5]